MHITRLDIAALNHNRNISEGNKIIVDLCKQTAAVFRSRVGADGGSLGADRLRSPAHSSPRSPFSVPTSSQRQGFAEFALMPEKRQKHVAPAFCC